MPLHPATSSSSAIATSAAAATASRSWCIAALPISATASATASPSSMCATRTTRGCVDFIACPAGHARHPPADPRRPAAGGQRAERLDHAGIPEREGLLRRLARRQAEGPKPLHVGYPRLRHLQARRSRREIGFMPVDGLGPHRIWYAGGRYAYASIHFADFTDHILAVDRHGAIRASRRSPAAAGFQACGVRAAKRRPGRAASATRCIMRWSPATSPMRLARRRA